jgi:hypothetical protein
VAQGNGANARGGTSARSSATTPNPPARKIRFERPHRLTHGVIDERRT